MSFLCIYLYLYFTDKSLLVWYGFSSLFFRFIIFQLFYHFWRDCFLKWLTWSYQIFQIFQDFQHLFGVVFLCFLMIIFPLIFNYCWLRRPFFSSVLPRTQWRKFCRKYLRDRRKLAQLIYCDKWCNLKISLQNLGLFWFVLFHKRSLVFVFMHM